MPKIISFGWTTPALLAGAKTCTRRDWSPRHAVLFKPGDVCWAYNKNPRALGRPVAEIRIVRVSPEPVPLAQAPPQDYAAEGFEWFDQHPEERALALPKLAKGLGLASTATMYDLWLDWLASGESLYVVRFELLEVIP